MNGLESAVFGLAVQGDEEQIFSLIQDRIQWMDDQGISQWNTVGYWDIFPPSYYRKAIEDHRLYVLKLPETGKIIGAGVLADQDLLWGQDNVSAFYLHNFVADRGVAGTVGVFLSGCEDLARSVGKERFRLDCIKTNLKLNRYYEARGYRAVGSIEDGKYVGNKREKVL